MKYLFLSALCALSSPAFGQPANDTLLLKIMTLKMQRDEHGRGYYELVQDADGTREELFVRGKEWIFKAYNSGKSVVQMEDKEAGLIIGKGYIGGLTYDNMGFSKDAGGFIYRITLRFKDGKYKCAIDNIKYEKGDIALASGADISDEYPDGWPSLGKKKSKKEWGEMVAKAESDIKTTISSLAEFMLKKDNSQDRW